MLLHDINNIKSTRKDLRNFGFVIGTFLAGLGGFLFWSGKDTYVYFLISGVVFLLLGLLIPVVLLPLQKVWMAISVILGWFMTRVILSVLFYLVLTPLGLLTRLFKKQFLDLKIDKSQESYWNYRSIKEFDPGEYERQF